MDQDGDGVGEYGWLGELAGIDGCRGTNCKTSSSPFIAAVLGVKDAAGRSQKSGYYFACYLPSARGRARAEPPGPDVVVTADGTAQARRYACYAWPATVGVSGQRAFVVTHDGEVYATANDGPGQRYSGTTRVPRPDAALDVAGPDPANLDAPVAGRGARAGDGGRWVPAG